MTLAAEWQVCCDLYGSNCMILVFDDRCYRNNIKVCLCSKILGVKINICRIEEYYICILLIKAAMFFTLFQSMMPEQT